MIDLSLHTNTYNIYHKKHYMFRPLKGHPQVLDIKNEPLIYNVKQHNKNHSQ
jgi:hypothetical protein